MHNTERQERPWVWWLGWLFFALAWLLGALAPNFRLALVSWQVLACLMLTSLCWSIYGWQRAPRDDAQGRITRETQAFAAAIWAIVPWLGFVILMGAPYALGVQQWVP